MLRATVRLEAVGNGATYVATTRQRSNDFFPPVFRFRPLFFPIPSTPITFRKTLTFHIEIPPSFQFFPLLELFQEKLDVEMSCTVLSLLGRLFEKYVNEFLY